MGRISAAIPQIRMHLVMIAGEIEKQLVTFPQKHQPPARPEATLKMGSTQPAQADPRVLMGPPECRTGI